MIIAQYLVSIRSEAELSQRKVERLLKSEVAGRLGYEPRRWSFQTEIESNLESVLDEAGMIEMEVEVKRCSHRQVTRGRARRR